MYYLLYGFLYLLSLLPLRLLYVLSDGLYELIYYVFGYRKEVVMNNLRIAFPEKNEKERRRIAKKFYRNLVDYFFESIKLLSITDKELNKRCTGNFNEPNAISKTGTSIQLHCGHQFNWEFVNRIFSQRLTIPFALVYMPVSNKIFDRLFRKIRTINGTVLINAANYRTDILKIIKTQHALAIVADQNPVSPSGAYWFYFFSKPAPFLYTFEKSARRSKVPVGFVNFKRIKRGYYKIEIQIITHNTAELPEGELTRKYRDFLQQQITEQPDNYLWSHRRWKHQWKEEYGSVIN